MTLADLTLVHYAARPVRFDPRFKYGEGGSYKPRGFWVSVQGADDWPAWCEG